ncbi:MAG: thiamine pyrophosphate-binding protein [Planctomycetaceae bacterium]
MTQRVRGADLLIRTLSSADVKELFTLSGNQIMPVFDACIDEGVNLIHVRHEAAAVHMADAYGRLTQSPGVALVTAGPGFANTLSALYVAYMAESPLVLLSGHAPRHQLGKGAFQEMNQAEMAGHVVKASWASTESTNIGHDIARAFRIAVSGRPGPVHVSLPFDLLNESVTSFVRSIPQPEEFSPVVNLLDHDDALNALNLIASAKRPIIITGPTLARGRGREFAHSLSVSLTVPVIPMESPRGLNDPALGQLSHKLREADFVLSIGQPLNFALRFGDAPHFHPDCRFGIIDPEIRVIEQASRNLEDENRLVLAALADSSPAIERLVQVCESNPPQLSEHRDEWTSLVNEAIAFRPDEWNTIQAESQNQIHPAQLCRTLQAWLSEDAEETILISDGGEFGQWVQACVTADRRVINGPSGSIGSAIPFALAARCVDADAKIVTCLGDGTMGFHIAEFETAIRHGLPFVAIVGNDACWNAERQIQLRNYGTDRLIGCDLLPTRYDEVVTALGGHGEFVQSAEELKSAFQRAFASGKPACINVTLEGQAAPTYE